MIAHLVLVGWVALASVEGAEQEYRAGRFAQARQAYAEVLKREGDGPLVSVGALYYNLGNCEFALGNYAVAVLRFRQAWRHLPRDPRVEANLKLSEERLGLPGDATRSPRATLAAALRSASPAGLLLSVLLLESVGLFGLATTWRARPKLRVVWIVVVLSSLSLVGAVIWERWLYIPRDAIILTPEWVMRKEPDIGSDAVVTLGAGERVDVLEVKGRSIRVSHRRGSGWGERDHVGRVVHPEE